MRKQLVGLLPLLLLACGGAPDASSSSSDLSLTVSGNADSFVSTYSSTATHGNQAFLRVGKNSLTQTTYLSFNVSSLPAHASNLRATLKLHASTTSTDVIEAHVAKSTSWKEATLDLANAPGAEAAVLSKVTGTTAGQWSSWDVSSAIQNNGVVSFVLETAAGATVEFASREAGSSTAPELVIDYLQNPLFGAAFDRSSSATYDSLDQAWGGMGVTRSYDGGKGVSEFAKYQTLDVAHGAATAFSFKYAPADVIAGKHDADLKSFFQSFVDGHPVFWTYYHEPDDQIFKDHTFTASDYRAAWAHIRAIGDQVKASRPKMISYATFIMMEYSLEPKIAPSRPLTGSNGMYPGDDVIDVFGIDAYNSSATSGTLRDPSGEFDTAMAFATQHQKPWAIGELGSCPVKGNPDGQSTFLKNAIDYWISKRDVPMYVAYFDVKWPACDYRMDAKSTALWKTAITQGLGGL